MNLLHTTNKLKLVFETSSLWTNMDFVVTNLQTTQSVQKLFSRYQSNFLSGSVQLWNDFLVFLKYKPLLCATT